MDSVLRNHIDNKEFHHAYLLAGDYDVSREAAFEAAKIILGRENLTNHPDFFYEKFELFGINESHNLIFKANQRPFWGENKVFVAEIFSFSVESANALLKTFEEPFEGTHFFIIVPSPETVIPTLRSRFTIIDNKKDGDIGKKTKEECREFLRSLPAQRIKMAEKFLKDKEEAMEFINSLEIVLSEESNFSALETVQRARKFLFDRSASIKMIMEYLALSLPRMI
jgi:hypothetical protein